MPHLPFNSQAWNELHRAFQQRSASSGIRLIHGPSVQITAYAQKLLEQSASGHYFLCSGDGHFHLPCYTAFLDDSPTQVEAVEPFHMMDYSGISVQEAKDIYTPEYALHKLERNIAQAHNPFQPIVLEFLVTPDRANSNFVRQLFLSQLPRLVPIVVLFHEQETLPPSYDALPHAELIMLYMAGGRIQDTEWRQITDHAGLSSNVVDRHIKKRHTGTGSWVTYSSRTIALLAQHLFEQASTKQKRQYAQILLKILPLGITYPLLSIASYTQNTTSLLACYTSSAVKISLMQPTMLLAYYRALRRSLKHTDNASLLEAATVNTLCALLCCYTTSPEKLHALLQKDTTLSACKTIKARVLFALGQILIQSNDQRLLAFATTCFQQSRTLLEMSHSVESYEMVSRSAAINNGEALIALKQRRYMDALHLETDALAHLREDQNEGLVVQQAMLLTHIGDIYARTLKQESQALPFYREAAQLIQNLPSPGAKIYVLPRLYNLLLKKHQFKEATALLEIAWNACVQSQKTDRPISKTVKLGIGLTLAQVAMQRGMQRKAACYYLTLLRESTWLKPLTVRGIVTNLTQSRPSMSMLLRKYITRITVLQEGVMNDIAYYEHYISQFMAEESHALQGITTRRADEFHEEEI